MEIVNAPSKDILLIGYGNPGRQDDGLGPALAELVEGLELPSVTVDSDYQLTVEHAEMAAHHKTVIFADAAMEGEEMFSWSQVVPTASGIRFTSHHLGPADVLALARDLFAAEPTGYLLAMRGRCFGEFESGLSAEAQSALQNAASFLIAKTGNTERVMNCGQ